MPTHSAPCHCNTVSGYGAGMLCTVPGKDKWRATLLPTPQDQTASFHDLLLLPDTGQLTDVRWACHVMADHQGGLDHRGGLP